MLVGYKLWALYDDGVDFEQFIVAGEVHLVVEKVLYGLSLVTPLLAFEQLLRSRIKYVKALSE